MAILSRVVVRLLYSAYHKFPAALQYKIVSFLVKFHLTGLIYKNKSIVCTIEGIKYELWLDEMIDSAIYYTRCYEPLAVAFSKKYVKKGMVALDVGANMGFYALHLAKLVGRGGKVIAFEPTAWGFSRLKRNVQLNDFSNIICEKIALSDCHQCKQPARFRSSFCLVGTPHVENFDEMQAVANIEEDMDFMSLDEYVRINKIGRIDFMKIDVDGYEYKVICGARESLGRFKPTIVIEFGYKLLKRYGDNLEDLYEMLTSLGYIFYSLDNLSPIDRKTLLKPYVLPINAVCSPSPLEAK